MIQFFNTLSSTGLLDLTNANIICDGNSLTSGVGGTAYPTQLSGLFPFVSNESTITNKGVGGQTTEDMIDDYQSDIASLYNSNKDNNILIAWEIRNDLVVNEPTVTTAYNRFVSYCQLGQATGFRVIAVTVLPSWTANYQGNGEAGWLQLDVDRKAANTLIKDNYTDYADEIADIASIDGLSNLEDTYQTGYTFSATRPTESANGLYDDGTHLTTAGYSLIATEVGRAIQRIKKA